MNERNYNKSLEEFRKGFNETRIEDLIVDIDGIPVKLIKQVNTLDEVDIVCISPVYDYEMVTRFLVELKPEIRTIALCDVVSEIWS